MKMADLAEDGQTPVVLYLGDHDPTGIRMTRDVGAADWSCTPVGPSRLERVALNMSPGPSPPASDQPP